MVRIKVVTTLPRKWAILSHAIKTGLNWRGNIIKPNPNKDRVPKR
jgi:hypothetical protein